jgi:hypothetical protein
MATERLTIAKAAVRDSEGRVIALEQPARHHDVIWAMMNLGYPQPVRGEQGFMTSEGDFVDRRKARVIAASAGQLLPRARPNDVCLYTEDVWEGKYQHEKP